MTARSDPTPSRVSLVVLESGKEQRVREWCRLTTDVRGAGHRHDARRRPQAALSFSVGCDKCCTMTWMRIVVLVLALAVVAGCSGGGGGSSSIPPSASWQKFRHDVGNTGQGGGAVVRNPGSTPTPVAILWSTTLDNSPISASPAIGIDNIIFIGSEGGTLAALNPSDGSSTWPSFVSSCDACACPETSGGLGPLISSPAVYTNNFNSQTSVFVGSTNGSLYGFDFTGNNPPACVFCFQPACTDGTLTAASFASSPSFTINPATLNVAAVFIGATVTDDSGATSGRLYALNANGTVQWQYPKPGAPRIGPITSSPAISASNTVYFTTDKSTTDEGFLYAFTVSSDFLWRTELAGGAALPLAPSPVANASHIFASSPNGVILALNTDGSFSWDLDAPSDDPGDGLANSLAVGAAALTPTPIGTPTPESLTPTLTPVPLTTLTNVVVIRRSGSISLINASTGMPPPTPTPSELAKIAGPVLSSPALSSDGYIVIGDHDGVLHAISTFDGTEPASWNWPVTLVPNAQATPQPIRSSPALDNNGVAYVGSDDGYVYAVGVQ
jgi:outer membrane protein assembly factor BamB